MKTLKSTDHVSIAFGIWFDKTGGNSYFDASVCINEEHFFVAYQYGYNAGSNQSIDDVLKECGYKTRKNTKDRFKPYRAIHTSTCKKLKRELYK